MDYCGARANACSHCTVAQTVKTAQCSGPRSATGNPRLDQAAKREDYPTSLNAELSWKMAVNTDFQPGGAIHRGLEKSQHQPGFLVHGEPCERQMEELAYSNGIIGKLDLILVPWHWSIQIEKVHRPEAPLDPTPTLPHAMPPQTNAALADPVTPVPQVLIDSLPCYHLDNVVSVLGNTSRSGWLLTDR